MSPGRVAVTRNRFVTPAGGQHSVNRDLETKVQDGIEAEAPW
jgi:hypothetical protein